MSLLCLRRTFDNWLKSNINFDWICILNFYKNVYDFLKLNHLSRKYKIPSYHSIYLNDNRLVGFFKTRFAYSPSQYSPPFTFFALLFDSPAFLRWNNEFSGIFFLLFLIVGFMWMQIFVLLIKLKILSHLLRANSLSRLSLLP